MRDLQTMFPKGKVVGNRYIIEELLGTGGFGAVYRVRDRRVKGNIFALKEMFDPQASYGRHGLTSECDILKRLDHYALPRVYRVFDDGAHNHVYMLMDYIDGPNLERLRIKQPERRFSLPQVMRIMEPIIEGVSYLHAQQPPIIHRDIKPANIIVPTASEGGVLVDFGIAKEYEQDSTTTAVRHCSPGYGAPEHYAHGTNTRTDIYSLGATFYTLLTGEVPIDALRRMTKMSSKGIDPLEPANTLLATIPQEVADILTRAMTINSNDRFATVEEFWQALKACTVEEVTEPVVAQEVAPVQDADLASETPIPPSPPDTTPPTGSVRHLSHVDRVKGGRIFVLCLLVLIVLIGGVAFSTVIVPGIGMANNPTPTANVRPSPSLAAKTPVPSPAAIVTAVATQATTPTPQATPQATIAATPTVASTTYPTLARSYNGTISNTYTNPPTNTSMSLTQIEQKSANISGYFSVGPGLVGNGNFTGTVTIDNKIQFLVPSYGGLLPLHFEGQRQTDGSLAGTYCSYQNNSCNLSAGGYGNWQASPA